jgi:hypothetical protein
LKKWLTSLPDVYIDDNPVEGSVHTSAKKNHSKSHAVKVDHAPTKQRSESNSSRRTALLHTLESNGGRICISALKSAYRKATNNIPPYPAKGTIKWVLSVEGVQVTKSGWVQFQEDASEIFPPEENDPNGGWASKTGKRKKASNDIVQRSGFSSQVAPTQPPSTY